MAGADRGEVGRCAALRRELRRDPDANLLLRVERRAVPHDRSACWVWLGSLDEAGYARVWWQGRNWHLPRALLTALAGPLRPDQEVHHTCGNRWCAIPAHLEAVHWRGHRRLHRRGAKGVRA